MAESEERTPKEAFVEKLDFIARNKLERIILDTMGHPEQIPQDFFELRDVARQNCFLEIEEGFRLILEQIGETQSRAAIDRIRSRGERRRDEADLQQYLIEKPERLGLIEPGLAYLAHEKRIKSGRLDILAEDKSGREVKIELKARAYDPRKSNFQIMKYFNDDKSEEGRLMFIAPTIDPSLITSLAQYQKAGRMSFFEFKKQDGDYSFSEVKPEDIKDPVPIDWTKRRKREVDEKGLVTVTSSVGKRASKSEEETELTSYPLYYQILLQNRPNLRDKKRYLKPIFIERNQMEALEELVSSRELDRALDALERNIQWELPDPRSLDVMSRQEVVSELVRLMELVQGTVTNKTKKIAKERIFERIRVYTRGLFYTSFEIFEFQLNNVSNPNIEPNDIIINMANSQKRLSDIVINSRYSDKILIGFRNLINKTLRKAVSSHDDKTEDIARKWLFFAANYTGALFDQFLQTKIKRAKELAEIDKEIAISYSIFNPLAYSKLAEREVDGFAKTVSVIDNSVMIDFVKRDTQLYKSILSNLRIREEDKKPVADQKPELIALQVEKQQEPKPRIPTPSSLLRDSILHNHKEALDDDANARLDYFIEDVLQRGYDARLEQLCDSFSHFNLGKRMRRREDRPSDMQLRNFFDDVQLKYVRRGEVPSAQDLEHLYEEDCKSEVSKSSQ